MARQLDPRLRDILAKYHDDPRSALWDCHGTWAIYHKDVEKMAARAGIQFDPPVVVEMNSAQKIAVICVTGHLGGQTVWSFGEASPHNNKNAYCVSMAEKRAIDRVVLKLLGLHGEVYSEEEADDFKQQRPPEPVVAHHDHDVEWSQTKRDALIKAMDLATNEQELAEWGSAHNGEIQALLEADRQCVRAAYKDHLMALRNNQRAA